MVRSSLATALALAVVAVVSVLAVGCGSKPEPATPSLSDPSGAASGPMPAPSADPEAAAGAEPARRQRKPFPIHSSCSEVVTIAFGDDPKAPGAGKRTVAPNSSIDGPRDADGKQTVWLLDDKGEQLVKVNITRGMKTLEIGRSCRTLDAR